MKKLKRIFLTLGLALSSAAFANAGDFAEFRLLGFSPDGKYFAFEQFGIQDGSGFPYAERFVIDVETDSFVKGSPFKLRIEDESASLKQARDQVANRSSDLLNELEIDVSFGRIFAFNPNTEITDGNEIKYHSTPYEPNPNAPYQINLETFGAAPPKPCSDFMDEVKAFRLKFKAKAEQPAETIYEDTSVPKSRLCPIDYRLGGVVTFEDFPKKDIHIYLVLIKSMGFEGPDGRWIAVPNILKND